MTDLTTLDTKTLCDRMEAAATALAKDPFNTKVAQDLTALTAETGRRLRVDLAKVQSAPRNDTEQSHG